MGGAVDAEVLPLTMAEILRDRSTVLRLVGTTGAWFLYDVSYYGTAIFTPHILSDIFPVSSLLGTCWRSTVVSAMGIPACALAVLSLRFMSGRMLNVVGFLLVAGSFAALAVVYQMDTDRDCRYTPTATEWPDTAPAAGAWSNVSAPGDIRSAGGGVPTLTPGDCGVTGKHPQLKFVLFCIITFFLNFGPNVGTFVVPATAFPTVVRGTCHGISAAGAKAGATAGTFMYPALTVAGGLPLVLWTQVAAAVLGALVSFLFLRNTDRPDPRFDSARLHHGDESAPSDRVGEHIRLLDSTPRVGPV
eukprot:TRINITY_DN70433_c0_g1_i1.p1 TRINITY_DN70433_c0_g1~~TRINITY_DN70433_c0_g1_i1.p1  ORF type:complete len:303 (-),score=49.62 TRINITY_DN70433_c0_g1_i1:636-1544(-)